jgi:hypothetical protein
MKQLLCMCLTYIGWKIIILQLAKNMLVVWVKILATVLYRMTLLRNYHPFPSFFSLWIYIYLLLSRKFVTNLYLCVSNFYFSMWKQHLFSQLKKWTWLWGGLENIWWWWWYHLDVFKIIVQEVLAHQL